MAKRLATVSSWTTRPDPDTLIEVVTEGILTRRLQSDPSLEGVAAVIFDEFHERNLQADLGLALCLDCQAGLREDLRILVMSATLDVGPIAELWEMPPLLPARAALFPSRPGIWENRLLTVSGILSARRCLRRCNRH